MNPERQTDGIPCLCSQTQGGGRLLRLLRVMGRFIALAALAFSGVALQAQSFSPPISVSKSPIRARADAIVVDSNGNIVAAWRDASGISFSRSTDGQTFSSPQTISNSGGGSFQPQIAADSSGNTNLIWDANDLLFSRSSDGGQTFSNPTDVSRGQGTLNSAPQMALGPKGEIDVVWGRADVFFSQSTDGGATFSAPLKLNVVPLDTGGPRIAVAADDTTYVIWADDLNHPQCNIFFTKSIDSGTSFSVPSSVPNSGCPFDSQVLVDGAGNIDVLWPNSGPNQDIFLSRSTNGGSTFSSPLDLSSGSGFEPQMVVDMSGNLNVVWVGQVSGASGAVFLRRSPDGTNFSPAKTINAPGPVGTLPASSPQIAVDSSGKIDIAWQQGASGSDDTDDTLFSYSNDGGSNFSLPVMVSQKSSMLAGTVQMALSSAGDVNLIWSDPPNLFFSRAAATASTGGDFRISAAPAPLIALPGGSATTQVTLVSTGGFNQSVALSCSKLARGASCSFDTTSITPSNSGAHASLTLNIPPTFAPGSFSFTIGAVAGNTTHAQDVQVTVGGLTGSIAPTAATISVGSSSTFNVSLNSTGGFSGQVNLACGGAPSGIACSFSPAQLNVPVNGSATSTLTVQVSTKPSGSLSFRGGPQALPVATQVLTITGLALLLLLVTTIALPREVIAHLGSARVVRPLAAIVLAIALGAAMVSCGGATTSSRAVSGGGTAATSSGTGNAAGSSSNGVGAGSTGGSGGSGGSSSVTSQVMVRAQSGGATVDIGSVSITVP